MSAQDFDAIFSGADQYIKKLGAKKDEPAAISGFDDIETAILGTEGSGESAVSSKGATGRMQIMPGTFKQYAQEGESFDNEAHRVAAARRKIADDYEWAKAQTDDPEKQLGLTFAAYQAGRGGAGKWLNGRGNEVSDGILNVNQYVDRAFGKMGKVRTGAAAGEQGSNPFGTSLNQDRYDIGVDAPTQAQQDSDENPVSTSLGRGWNSMTTGLGLAKDAVLNDPESAAQRMKEFAEYDQANPQTSSAKEFMGDWTAEKYGQALFNIPGLLAANAEQVANMVPSMVGGIPGAAAGASMGAAAGPWGAFIGGVLGFGAGSAPGTMAVEGGMKTLAKMNEDGIDPNNIEQVRTWLSGNRDALIEYGLVKGGTVAALDMLAGGIGGAVVMRPALRVAQAQTNALRQMGVNAADKQAVAAAVQTPAFRQAMAPALAEFGAANTTAKNLMRGVVSFGAETGGEVGGEYLGEKAATGEGNWNEAMLEGVMSGATSAVTTGAEVLGSKLIGRGGNGSSPNAVATPAAPAPLPTNQPNSPLSNAANAAANAAPVVAPTAPVAPTGQQMTADEALALAQQRLSTLEVESTGIVDRTVPGPDGKPMVIPGQQPRLFTAQEREEYKFLKQNLTNPEALAKGYGVTLIPSSGTGSAGEGAGAPNGRAESLVGGRNDSTTGQPSEVASAGGTGESLNAGGSAFDGRISGSGEPVGGGVSAATGVSPSVSDGLAVGEPKQSQAVENNLTEKQNGIEAAETQQASEERPTQQAADPAGVTPDIPTLDRYIAKKADGTYAFSAEPPAELFEPVRTRLFDLESGKGPAYTEAAAPATPTPDQPATASESAPGAVIPPTSQPVAAEAPLSLSDRPTEELRTQLKNAQSGSVRRAIADELAKREQAEIDNILKDVVKTASGSPFKTEAAAKRALPALGANYTVAPANSLHPKLTGFVIRRKTEEEKIEQAVAATNTAPTEAQKEAGNYAKGPLTLHGLNIRIETPKGERRRPEWPPMTAHYGYFSDVDANGADGDKVDVFIGPKPELTTVFVIDQKNADGSFDEAKVMLGYRSANQAKAAYLGSYTPGFTGFGAITEMSLDQFKDWLKSDRTMKAVAYQKPVANDDAPYLSLLNLKTTKALSSAGGRALYEVKIPQSFKDKYFKLGRGFDLPQSSSFELREKSQVTGNQSDNGYILIDKREQVASRAPVAKKGIQETTKEDDAAAEAAYVAKTAKNEQVAPDVSQTQDKSDTSEPKSSVIETKPAGYGSDNKLVSAERAAILREKLKKKLNGSQLNSGIDPEILAAGAELAVFHIEAGARSFAKMAKAIAADLDMSLDKLKPYLRSWYNGSRDMLEDAGLSIEGMDDADTVRAELAKLSADQSDIRNSQTANETNTTPAATQSTEKQDQPEKVSTGEAETGSEIVRYASGMSSIGDLTNGTYARSGHKLSGIGVDIGEVSKNGIKQLARAILNWRVPVFIDSGAFGAFRKSLKGDDKAIDFDGVLGKYWDLVQEISNLNEVEETDYPRPLLVMPDVVGDQATSLSLIERYQPAVKAYAQSNLARPIIPLQKGDLTLSQAYAVVVKSLGTDNFIVGLPSNAQALTQEDIGNFLSESKPKAVHFLGAAAQSRLQPFLDLVEKNSPDTKVTADASQIRSKILNAVASGMTRQQAINAVLSDSNDPGVVRDLENSDKQASSPEKTPDAHAAKWFGGKPKATAYIVKNKLMQTHEAKEIDGKWRIVPKAAAPVVAEQNQDGDGQQDELDAEMRSYEEKAEADQAAWWKELTVWGRRSVMAAAGVKSLPDQVQWDRIANGVKDMLWANRVAADKEVGADETAIDLPQRLVNMSPGEKSTYQLDEKIALAKQRANYNEPISEEKNQRGTSFTPEMAMHAAGTQGDRAKELDGQLRSGNRTGATTNELIDAWVRHSQGKNEVAASRSENPEMWAAYDERQAKVKAAESGAKLLDPYPSSEHPFGQPVTLDRKFSKNWRVKYADGHTALFNPETLRPPVEVGAGETSAEKPGVVTLPGPVSSAMQSAMEKQKRRAMRLRTESEAEGLNLEQKLAAQTKVKAADATLRAMRTGIFAAEDAAVKALASKDISAFAEHEMLFPEANEAIAQLIGGRVAVEESDQDRSMREWTENYDRVANTDDLSTVSTVDLERAENWAASKKQREQRKGWDGGDVNSALINALSGEIDRIKAEVTRRNPSAKRINPGEPGYTLEMADADLDAMLAQANKNGIIEDDRLNERIKRQEKLIADMKAEAARNPVTIDASGKTRAEVIQALQDGQRIKREGTTTWIEETTAGKVQTYVIKSKDDDSDTTFTKGPAGPDRQWGWGKLDAAQKAVESWSFSDEVAENQSEPNLAEAKVLLAKQKAATGNKRAEVSVRAEIRALAAKTPLSDEKTVLALDMAATRLDMDSLSFADARVEVGVASEPEAEATDFDSLLDSVLDAELGAEPAPKSGNELLVERMKADKVKMDKARVEGSWAYRSGQDRLPPEGLSENEARAWLDAYDNAPQPDSKQVFEPKFGPTEAPEPRSAGKAAASAVKNAGSGMLNAAKGLNALFAPKPGTLGSGPVFNEDTYAAAKPYFQMAIADLKSAGTDIKEMVVALVRGLVANGLDRTAIKGMSPYLERFVKETVAGYDQTKEVLDDDQSSTAADGADGNQPLEGAPAKNVPTPESGRGSGKDRTKRGGGNRASDGDSGGSRLPAGGSLGNGTGDLFADAGGAGQQSGSAGLGSLPGNSPAKQSAVEKPRDYVISEATRLGEGGAKTKYKNNVAAIRLINALEQEGRQATAEEQHILARYVGWGALSQVFDAEHKDWTKEHAELKSLLTEEEWDAASMSTQYAHYTSEKIITNGIYAGLRHMGFAGGRVLEPGSGVGNTAGLMPVDFRTSGMRITGIERERIAARIAQNLYPNQIMLLEDFTKFNARDGEFDAVAGNPPFSSTALIDQSGRKHLNGLSIHNYFFAKSIDMLRPGGVFAMVVSNGFMDASTDRARTYIGNRAKLLGAIRLPNNAFKSNAGTEVTTDIIFLQKRPESEWESKQAKDELKAWNAIVTVEDPLGGDAIPLNSYFAANPQMMLGRMERSGSLYRAGSAALVDDGQGDIAERLQAAIRNLPANAYQQALTDKAAQSRQDTITALQDTSQEVGSYYLHDGKLFVRLMDEAGEKLAQEITPATQWTEKTVLGENQYERLKALATLRGTASKLLAAELADNQADMDALRAELNTQYDHIVKKWAHLSADSTKKLIGDDPFYPLLVALETGYDKGITKDAAKKLGISAVAPRAKKMPIFSQRVIPKHETVTSAESPADALMISISERGKIDTAYMAELLKRFDIDEVLKELERDGELFLDPATNGYVLRDEYLSGNVRRKLDLAKRMQNTDHVRALEAVLPEDVPAHEIVGRIGAAWIPVATYEAFATELLGEGTRAKIEYRPLTGGYEVTIGAGSEVANSNTWGTADMGGSEILERLLNKRDIRIGTYDDKGKFHLDAEKTAAANDKATDIKSKFGDWLFQEADRSDAMVRAFNDTVNNYVTRIFDGLMLKFPGKTPDAIIKLRRHQRNAVARILQTGQGLLDHVVGSGKTFTVIASAMELRRTGLAHKPMIVVPNHLVKQWASDFYRLYPGAKILAATKKDFEKANRRAFLARIATGDWDAVIMAHSSFGFIKPDPDFETKFNNDQIKDIMAAIEELGGEVSGQRNDKSDGRDKQTKRTVKQLMKMKESLENRIKSLRDKPVDSLLDFAQIGVDQLFVDEAHLFKNLMYATKMNNVRGLNDPKGSQRAFDMYIKAHQIMNQNGGDRGVVFATGTPVSNSLAEMYHMMRFLMPTALNEAGFRSFDAWADTFASVDQVWMQSMSGAGYKSSNRMANFINAPELLKMFDQVADTVTNDDVKEAYSDENGGAEFPLPRLAGGRREPVSLVRTEAQQEYMDEIAERAKKLEKRKGPPQKGEDNMLSILGDARKAAMDIRLVDNTINQRDPEGRIAMAAKSVLEFYKKYDAAKGTQLIFSDMGTPLKTAKKEMAEYDALAEVIAAGSTQDVLDRAELGDESAQGLIDKAEEAQAELDAKGKDWLDAIKSALRGFSIYDDMRAALIESGIPDNEIAFIHDYNTDEQKAALFKAVNTGKIRILMGSTPKMGAGTNVQERLVALHHLDVPWRPSDVEQREGRIIRQGNVLAFKPAGAEIDETIPGFEVAIRAYATQDTLDLFMWQLQEQKLKMIGQLRTGKVGREIDNAFEDLEMSAGEMQAAATSNPYLMDEIRVKDAIKKLERQKRSFESQQNDLINRRAKAQRRVDEYPAKIENMAAGTAAFNRYSDQLDRMETEVTATVGGEPVQGAAAIRRAIDSKIAAMEVDAPYQITADDVVHTFPNAAAAQAFVNEQYWEVSHWKLGGAVIAKAKIASAISDAQRETATTAIKTQGIEFNGKPYKSVSALAEAVRNLLGDKEPILLAVGDETFNRRGAAEKAFEPALLTAIETDADTLIFNLGEFSVFAEGVHGNDESMGVSFRIEAPGFRDEGDLVLDGHDRFSPAKAKASAGRALITQVHQRLISLERTRRWFADELSQAQRSLSDLDKQKSGGTWSGEGELTAARDRHRDIVAKLNAMGKEQATTVDAVSADAPVSPEAPLESRGDGGFYSVVTVYDAPRRGKLIWSGRSGELALTGSRPAVGGNDTSTATQSVSVSSETARGNDGNPSPNPVLEALEDQTSESTIARRVATVNDIRASWVKTFGEKTVRQLDAKGLIHIVATAADLPPGVTMSATARASWNGDRAWFIADRMKSATAHKELLHEIGEHAGLERILGADGYDALIAQVKALRESGDAHVKEAWAFVKRNYVDVPIEQRPLIEGGKTFMREVLAQLGQNADVQKKPFWQQMIATVRRWLIQHFGFTGMLKVGDLQELVLHSLKTIARPDGNGPRGGQPIEALASNKDKYEGDTYIVFKPTQIKSAKQNNGEFSDTNPSILESRGNYLDALRDAGQTAANVITGGPSVKTFNEAWHKTVGTMYHLSTVDAEFKGVFDEVQAYMRESAHLSKSAESLAPDLIPQGFFDKPISTEDARAIAKPIFLGTLHKHVLTDGELARGWFEYVEEVWPDNMMDIDDDSGERIRPRMVTNRIEFAPLNDDQIGYYRQFRKATNRSVEDLGRAQLRRHFVVSGLPAGMVDQFMEITNSTKEFGDKVIDAVEQESEARGLDDDAADRIIEPARTIIRQINKLQQEGYAPLMRFGKFSVYAYRWEADPATGEMRQVPAYFTMFETERERNAAMSDLKSSLIEAYPGEDLEFESGILPQQNSELFEGMTPEMAREFAEAMGLEQDAAFQEYLQKAVNNNSALKRLIHRKGTAGYSEDAVRVLASFISSNARRASMLTHLTRATELTENIKRGDVKDMANELVGYVTDPKEEAGGLRSLLFFNFLGGSVASAAVNLTQTILQTAPYLYQRARQTEGGRLQLIKDMAAAQRLSFQMVIADAFGKSQPTVADDMRRALDKAADEGVTKPHEVYQLMAAARGQSLSRTASKTVASLLQKDEEAWGAKAEWGVQRFMRGWGSLFGMAEESNRLTAFMTAFKMARQRGLDETAAYADAVKAVNETQGIYGKGNRPQWSRGAMGAVLFTFKQFSIQYLEFMRRLYKNDKEAFLVGVAVLVGLAGMTGLPGSDDLDDLIDTFGQWMGFATNTKKARRQLVEATVGRVFGQVGTEFALHGISAVLPVDVHARLGLGNLIPGSAMLHPGKTSDQKLKQFFEVLGPAGGLVNNAFNGMERAAKGDMEHAFTAMAPSAVRNAYLGGKMMATGYSEDSKGRRVTDVDFIDASFKMIGLQPTQVSNVYKRRDEQNTDKWIYNNKRSSIAERWAEGMAHKNGELVADALSELRSWNRDHPNMRITIKPADVRRRANAMLESAKSRQTKATPKALREALELT